MKPAGQNHSSTNTASYNLPWWKTKSETEGKEIEVAEQSQAIDEMPRQLNCRVSNNSNELYIIGWGRLEESGQWYWHWLWKWKSQSYPDFY